MSKWSELADRVEAADKPDRALDADIALTLAPPGTELRFDEIPQFTLLPESRAICVRFLRDKEEGQS